jgi:hypothetical protein
MSNFNSFSGQPLVRLAPNRGQSPVSQGIDAGLSALDLAVEQGNQMQAQQFAGVMQALGGAVDVVQTVGNQQLRAASLEEQQRERALAQRIAAENEAERQRMRDRAEQVDAQREQERLARQLEIADKAVVRKAWNASRVELERQIAMNDPRIIDAVGLQGEELATWSRDYASAFAAGVGDQANVADDLDEIAAQVASVLTRKQIEVVRNGEEQLFIDTAQVLAAQANPQDFADAADVVVGSASMHTRQEAFAKTVIPALREDAEAGRIDLLNQKMQAIGMDNDPAYGVTVQELRSKAQAQQIALRTRQSEEIENSFRTELVKADRDPTANLESLNATLGTLIETGRIDSRAAEEFQQAISRKRQQRADEEAVRVQQLQYDELVSRSRNQAVRAIATGNAFALDDVEVSVPSPTGGRPMVLRQPYDERIADAMPVLFADIERTIYQTAISEGASEEEAQQRMLRERIPMQTQMAVSADYAPPQWRRTISAGIQQAQAARNNQASPLNESAPALAEAINLYQTVKATSPRMATLIANDDARAFYDGIIDQMAVPGTTIEQAVKFETSPRSTSTVPLAITDGKVIDHARTVADSDKGDYATDVSAEHILRIANARIRRGAADYDTVLKESAAYVKANSIIVNGVPVYLGSNSALGGIAGESGRSWVRGVEYWLDDIAKDYGDNAIVGGVPATGKDLTLWRDPDTGRFIVYDKRTREPVVPRDGEDAMNRLTFTWTDLVRKRVDPVRREQEQARRMRQVEQDLGRRLTTTFIPIQ